MDVGTIYREPRESCPHHFGHILAFWLWRLLGTAIWDDHLFSLGVLEFRDRVWSWRWELQASIFQLNQALREIKSSPGPRLAQSEMLNLEGPKQGLLKTRSLLTRTGHFDNKLGFLHTLAGLGTSWEGSKWPGVWLWQPLLGVSVDISDVGPHEHSMSGPRVPVNKSLISPTCGWPQALDVVADLGPSNSAIANVCCLS